jgi:cellulose biosynthesis protein BcsQ
MTHDALRIIAALNGKGGTGKTSITANEAALLAASGYRVLAIGLDPQGNLPLDLGMVGARTADGGSEFCTACLAGRTPSPVRDVRPGLDVISDGPALTDLAAVLVSRQGNGGGDATAIPAQLIRQLAVEGGYDMVFLDCPPGVEPLQRVALLAATLLLVPSKTDDASRAGLSLVADRYASVAEHNPDLQLLGAVMFGVNPAATATLARARRLMAADLGGDGLVFDQTIRHVESTAVESRARGRVAHELKADAAQQEPWWKGLRDGGKSGTRIPASAQTLAADYYLLAQELLARINKTEQQEDKTNG